MNTYRFIFRRANNVRSFFCDFLAQNKEDAMKQWTKFKKSETLKVTLIDIIKI